MSTYIISDIHGCYREFKQLLEKIGFSDKDKLYILGDVLDRGPEPILVLKDIMTRSNVYLIKGNHEEMALQFMQNLSGRDLREVLSKGNAVYNYRAWMKNGGATTLEQLCKLSKEEQKSVVIYLEAAYDYEIIEVNEKLYILVHGGLNNFEAEKELDEYLPEEILWARADYEKRYYPSERVFLVTGHTPTPLIRKDKKPLVYKGNGHIAIDCGCCFGGRLAAYCLETGETTYINSENFRGESNI